MTCPLAMPSGETFTFNFTFVDLCIQYNLAPFIWRNSPWVSSYSCLLFYHVSFILTACKMILSPGWDTWQRNELLKCLAAAAAATEQVEMNSSADRKEHSTISFMPGLAPHRPPPPSEAGCWVFMAQSKQSTCNLHPRCWLLSALWCPLTSWQVTH